MSGTLIIWRTPTEVRNWAENDEINEKRESIRRMVRCNEPLESVLSTVYSDGLGEVKTVISGFWGGGGGCYGDRIQTDGKSQSSYITTSANYTVTQTEP